MLQKNYTNPLDKGRYGFSASGKFNAPYKLETLLISITVAAGITAAVLVIVFAVQFVRSNPTGVATGRMLDSLMGVAILFTVAVAVAVTGLVIKVIAQGYSCSYIADEEKFMLDYGGTHRTIYYSEVQSVHFMPRSFFKTVHGYTVTVKINGADEEYAITSDGYLSESATPFYIIKERTEMLRHEEQLRRDATVQAVPLTSEPVVPVTREQIPLNDRVASLLGKDSEMPGISVLPRSDSAAVNSVENDTAALDMPPKPPSGVNEMPSVNADGRVTANPFNYIGTDGREHSVREIIAAGSFREVMRPGKAVAVGIAATIVYVIVFILIYMFGANVSNSTYGYGGIYTTIIMIAVIIAAPFYAGTIINFMKSGEIYSYKANGREFVTTTKSKKEERILYSDVQDVIYKKMEFLWFIKGYRVEILTRYGVVKYNYVCEGAHLPDTSVLPFEIIRERISKQK